ncbi:hypothetical protein [Bacillus sp. B-jedd]|uniref:hypothetical protein n=1 Tax=Bacillus sp. B-jedd TaxID=1476857 RepID=UPI0005156E13|nr:hypothetical protein [Bacillus sp. B-jedd]CEG28370.1 hypothetical protein BN1002_03286 [Bacillus sp. B-jedd]
MNQFNEELRNTLLGSLPEEAILSDQEKQQIRNRIKELKEKGSRKQRIDFFPKALTAIAAAAFLLAAGGLAGTKLGLLESGTGNPGFQSNLSFYEGFEKGAYVKGWEMVEKGPVQAENGSEDKWIAASFKGKTSLTGTLVYNGPEMGEKANQIFFLPDKEAVAYLPTEKSRLDELTFNKEDQKLVAEVFGLAPGSREDGVQIEITGYTAYTSADTELPDIIKFGKSIGPVEPKITYEEKQVTLDGKGTLALSEPLMQAYKDFARTHNNQYLETLDPFSVFLLHFYSEEIKDFRTQYYLYNDNPDVEKVFTSADELIKDSKKPDNMAGRNELLEKVKGNQSLKISLIGNDEAVVTISESEGLGFRIVRNHEGIWKISWMPIQ